VNATPSASVHWLWFFAPPFVSGVAVPKVLAWLQERASPPAAWRLAPFVGTQETWAWLPYALSAACGGVLVWLLLRWIRAMWGRKALLWTLALGWSALHLAASAALVARHLNVQALHTLPATTAQVLGSHEKPPSLRSLGGTLLVLQLQGQELVQQVLVTYPAHTAQWQAGQQVRVQWATGRWWGRYITGFVDA